MITQVTLIILGVVILGVVLVWAVRVAKREAEIHNTSLGEEFAGICATPLNTTIKKQANLKKILKMFENDKEVSNEEVRKALGVSSRTAVNYMDELQNQGKVVQIGKTGVKTTYRAK